MAWWWLWKAVETCSQIYNKKYTYTSCGDGILFIDHYFTSISPTLPMTLTHRRQVVCYTWIKYNFWNVVIGLRTDDDGKISW
jgi:hypothetical protein